ncbi:hypothetical protein PsAD13_03185 [Pseudovibrio sp. Ad13]|uniref:hypothetical protein n=1 Tax=Pseudovibrio sp. Ad13 TaxID=989396 RepID=UPI0007AE3F39|nr:hypothetical protein [Pseudovibrio sp. Ad13]KZK82983.1 hypothetical protein PsAD13_03185 [Pseudovibrio sp. Ad13]
MAASLEKVTALYEAVKLLHRERKKMETLSKKAFEATGQKQIERTSTNLNFQALEVTKLEHRAHAAAVNCGLADLREEEHYESYEASPSAWHQYNVQPDKPEALKEREAA